MFSQAEGSIRVKRQGSAQNLSCGIEAVVCSKVWLLHAQGLAYSWLAMNTVVLLLNAIEPWCHYLQKPSKMKRKVTNLANLPMFQLNAPAGQVEAKLNWSGRVRLRAKRFEI